jgi:arylsulfatase A-like enzyme
MTDSASDTESPGRLALVAEAAGMALATALVCALPAAVRGVQAGGAAIDGLVSSAALLLLLCAPAALLAPRAARGWRGVIGKEPPRDLAIGIALWTALAVLALTVLGTLLKARTNHRGLGGATFGVLGAIAVAGSAVVAARLLDVGRALRERGVPRTVVAGLAAMIVALPLGAVAVPIVQTSGDRAMQSGLFDLLLSVAVGALVLSRRPPEALGRAVRIGALPLAVCVLIVGLVRLETSPAAADAVRRGSGLPSALLWALERWSDRDGDGLGAHFGGRDCDEGDPRRHPGADDPTGDGLDADCDGRDGPLGPVAAVEPSPAGVAHAAAEPPPPDAQPMSDRPDIVLVTLDTVRADHTSLHGYERPTTPVLAELGARGVVFERAYAAGNDTQTALMPLVTGLRYADSAHTRTEWPKIRDEAETIAERLHGAGYATAAVTSFTWLRRDRGFEQGFDHFDESPWTEVHPEREITGDRAARAAGAIYEKLAGGSAPLFLWVHLFDAHGKYVEHPGPSFGKKPVDRYDGEIAFVDTQLGAVVRTIERSPRAARTLLVVHGSHGEAFGEHGKEGHGNDVYDEEVRVPLVVVAPGARPARWDADAVSILDVAPTLLDYAGAPRAGTAGVSLRAAIEGDAAFERPPVAIRGPRRLAIVDWPLKLVVRERKDGEDRLLLFDLAADPTEKLDVSDKRREDLVRMNALRDHK